MNAQDIVGLLAGKWVLPVLSTLSRNALRFNDLQRALAPGINDHSLTSTLRRLESHGLIEHARVDHHPPAFGYALTELAEGLLASMTEFFDWVDRHAGDLARGPSTTAEPGDRR